MGLSGHIRSERGRQAIPEGFQRTHQNDLQRAPRTMGRRTGAYQGGGGSTGGGIRPPRRTPRQARSSHRVRDAVLRGISRVA